MRSLLATGAFLVLLGCPLPSNVLYRCEGDGTCAAEGFTCAADGYCHPQGVLPDGGGDCVPRDVVALCATAECGFVQDGCGGERECERSCPPTLECGVNEPNRCAYPSVCTSEGWCWENPLPQGFSLNGVLRLDNRHTWFVGENRTVLFFDGERTRLQEAPAPPGVDLSAIHGTAPSDVYVVGNNGVTLHFDGTRWQREGTLTGFNNNLRTVWSLGDGGALAAGPGGRVLSRSALVDPFSRWTLETFPSIEDVREVFADSSGMLYAVTRRNELFTREPGRPSDWRRLDTVPLVDTFTGVAHAGGLTFGGNGLNRETVVHRDADGGWRALTDAGFPVLELVPGDGGLFLVGNSGVEFAWLDDAENLSRFMVYPGVWTAAAALPGPKLLLAGLAGSTAVSELDGGLSWRSSPRVTRGQNLNAVCGASPRAMVAVGGIDNGAACATCKVRWLEREVLFAGAHWRSSDYQLGSTTQLLGCYAETADRVWLMGNDSKFVFLNAGQSNYGDFGGGGLYGQYSGGWGNPDAGYIFTRRESPLLTTSGEGTSGFVLTDIGGGGGLRSVWGLGTDDILVAGLNGTTSRYDGTIWTQQYVGFTEFTTVHGALLTDGGRRYVTAGTGGGLHSIVGDAGATSAMGPAVNFASAWVSSRGTAWAVGRAPDGGAFVVRSEPGGPWAPEPLTSPRPVTGLFGVDAEDGGVTLWLTGPLGMILRKEE